MSQDDERSAVYRMIFQCKIMRRTACDTGRNNTYNQANVLFIPSFFIIKKLMHFTVISSNRK